MTPALQKLIGLATCPVCNGNGFLGARADYVQPYAAVSAVVRGDAGETCRACHGSGIRRAFADRVFDGPGSAA
jgi:hypothetical protein